MSTSNKEPNDNSNSSVSAGGEITTIGVKLASQERSKDIGWDKYSYRHSGAIPEASTAHTTFYSKDAENEEDRRFYDRLHPLNHNRAHKLEKYLNYTEPWGGEKKRQEKVEKYYRAETIVSQAEIPLYAGRYAVRRVTSESIVGFNAHYDGLVGATLGFAVLRIHDSPAEAKASYVGTLADERFDLGFEWSKLVEYVWRNYG